jgi:hypothetical protein
VRRSAPALLEQRGNSDGFDHGETAFTQRHRREARSGSRRDNDDVKRALLAGILGAVAASAGYLIYSRLEDEHKESLRRSVVKFVEDKVGELRAQFKI